MIPERLNWPGAHLTTPIQSRGVATETFVALDVEATGMDPTRHEIVEVAVVVFDGLTTRHRYSSVVRPSGPITIDIESLTGLSSADVAGAPLFADVATTLHELIGSRPIVGQSVWMDVAMLEAAGLSLPNPVIDTFEVATLLLPDMPIYTLQAVAKRLGIEPQREHRALADAELAADVFRALIVRLDEYDPETLRQLLMYARAGGWETAERIASIALSRVAGPIFEQPNGSRRGPHELAFLTPRERPEPLRRTASHRPIDPNVIRHAMAPDGPLSRVVPGYEYRSQQEAMSRGVARSLSDEGHLIVEAGTGTGKSVAYLLPSALHALERGEKVVVATNTLALQDQLYRKDIPDVVNALRLANPTVDLRATVLKGRANYLCLRRWFALHRQPIHDSSEARLRAKILMWLGETQTGDRAELRLTPDEEPHWRSLAEDEDSCVASRCVFHQRNQCFLYRARRQADHAHIVIVNHALLLSDTIAGSRVVPEYDRLIVDEAHHLEDQATAQFGFNIDLKQISDHLDYVARLEGSLINGVASLATSWIGRIASSEKDKLQASAASDRLRLVIAAADSGRSAAATVFARLVDIITRRDYGGGGFDRTLRITNAVRHDGTWLELELLSEPVDHALRELDTQLRWYVEAVEQLSVEDPDIAIQQDELSVSLSLAVRTGADLVSKLQSVISTPHDSMIYWAERAITGDRAALYAAPLHVGAVLQDQLFSQLRSLVLMSATLTTDGSFDFVSDRLGLVDHDQLLVSSPFDYEESTLLYLADDIPEPNAPGYQRRLQDTLIQVCQATQGRALVLFTSHASLQSTYQAIKRPLERAGILVLAQRTDGSPRQLIDRLKHTENVVVLGTATFWEGVDIVGSALSLLVITKLPFSVPSDPIFAARSELFDNPFVEFAVPQAVLKFKQGFGRLIRSSHDRGVCAVLDRRVLSKRYGASFVQSLPPCAVSVGSVDDLPDRAIEWLDDRWRG